MRILLFLKKKCLCCSKNCLLNVCWWNLKPQITSKKAWHNISLTPVMWLWLWCKHSKQPCNGGNFSLAISSHCRAPLAPFGSFFLFSINRQKKKRKENNPAAPHLTPDWCLFNGYVNEQHTSGRASERRLITEKRGFSARAYAFGMFSMLFLYSVFTVRLRDRSVWDLCFEEVDLSFGFSALPLRTTVKAFN